MSYNIIYAIFALASFGVGYATAVLRKNENPCDKCVYLKRKGGGGLWKYYCSKNTGGFDKPPTYCGDFKRREKE